MKAGPFMARDDTRETLGVALLGGLIALGGLMARASEPARGPRRPTPSPRAFRVVPGPTPGRPASPFAAPEAARAVDPRIVIPADPNIDPKIVASVDPMIDPGIFAPRFGIPVPAPMPPYQVMPPLRHRPIGRAPR
jgi:hypothetical protein